jgi:hypothetical protein
MQGGYNPGSSTWKKCVTGVEGLIQVQFELHQVCDQITENDFWSVVRKVSGMDGAENVQSKSQRCGVVDALDIGREATLNDLAGPEILNRFVG